MQTTFSPIFSAPAVKPALFAGKSASKPLAGPAPADRISLRFAGEAPKRDLPFPPVTDDMVEWLKNFPSHKVWAMDLWPDQWEQAVQTLQEKLANPPEGMSGKDAAFQALYQMDPPAEDDLMVDHTNTNIRTMLAASLKSVKGDKELLPWIQFFQNDPDSMVRLVANFSLSRIQDDRLVEDAVLSYLQNPGFRELSTALKMTDRISRKAAWQVIHAAMKGQPCTGEAEAGIARMVPDDENLKKKLLAWYSDQRSAFICVNFFDKDFDKKSTQDPELRAIRLDIAREAAPSLFSKITDPQLRTETLHAMREGDKACAETRELADVIEANPMPFPEPVYTRQEIADFEATCR